MFEESINKMGLVYENMLYNNVLTEGWKHSLVKLITALTLSNAVIHALDLSPDLVRMNKQVLSQIMDNKMNNLGLIKQATITAIQNNIKLDQSAIDKSQAQLKKYIPDSLKGEYQEILKDALAKKQKNIDLLNAFQKTKSSQEFMDLLNSAIGNIQINASDIKNTLDATSIDNSIRSMGNK